MMNFVLGLMMILGMNAIFYFCFVNKELISFKDYLKGVAKTFLKIIAGLIIIGSIFWIPMFMVALTN